MIVLELSALEMERSAGEVSLYEAAGKRSSCPRSALTPLLPQPHAGEVAMRRRQCRATGVDEVERLPTPEPARRRHGATLHC
jgi:hypothetical protein